MMTEGITHFESLRKSITSPLPISPMLSISLEKSPLVGSKMFCQISIPTTPGAIMGRRTAIR